MWITRQSCDQIRDVYTPLTLADNLAVFELHHNYQWSRSLRRVWGCVTCTTVKLTKAHSHSHGEANWNTYNVGQPLSAVALLRTSVRRLGGTLDPLADGSLGGGTKPLPKNPRLRYRPFGTPTLALQTSLPHSNQSINQAVYWRMVAAVSWINEYNNKTSKIIQ